jgi:nitrogen-specific signal transduction histidine kinase
MKTFWLLKMKTTGGDYKPQVSAATSTENGQLGIRVKGNGIPDAIKDKIMQPFFTTKPTGEGTGLGLSLSYDIVVKRHGGILILPQKPAKARSLLSIFRLMDKPFLRSFAFEKNEKNLHPFIP